MDKIKAVLKGESSHKSDSTSHSSTTGSVRDAAETAAADYKSSSATSGSTSSAPRTTGTTGATETFETTEQIINPAVEKETVKRLQEEQVQEVRDVERHQDHYHTTVQPLVDREVAPTVHKEQVAQTQYSEVDHDDSAKVKAALEAQAAQFQNTRTDLGTAKTQTDLGTIQSESVHHHMHETVQPVIEREIVQPSVVHTTIPVKEVHHEASHIHDTSVAAPVSIDEFQKTQGSSLT